MVLQLANPNPIANTNTSTKTVAGGADGGGRGNPQTGPSQALGLGQYSTAYRFEFGDRRGGSGGGGGGSGGGGGGPDDPDDPRDRGGGGSGGGSGGNPRRPKHSNLPDFLIPAQLITYQTSLEINVRRIRAASPPPPPKFVKKLLVNNEQLERKTRAFLSDTFDMSADSALRHARQKIRSAKSAFMSTDDDVKHATDTVDKAKARDFLNIYNPRLGPEKPLYEFVEVPSGECAAESKTGIPQPKYTAQQSEDGKTMSEYTSSRYSARSSRKSKIEGEWVWLEAGFHRNSKSVPICGMQCLRRLVRTSRARVGRAAVTPRPPSSV